MIQLLVSNLVYYNIIITVFHYKKYLIRPLYQINYRQRLEYIIKSKC